MNTDDPKFTAHALGDIDDLTPAERAEIEALLASDADAAAEAAETRALAARLRAELQSEQSAPLTAGQRAAVLAANVVPVSLGGAGEVESADARPRRSARWLAPLALAASVALCASLAWKTAFHPQVSADKDFAFTAPNSAPAQPTPDEPTAPHPEPEGLATKVPASPSSANAKPAPIEMRRPPSLVADDSAPDASAPPSAALAGKSARDHALELGLQEMGKMDAHQPRAMKSSLPEMPAPTPSLDASAPGQAQVKEVSRLAASSSVPMKAQVSSDAMSSSPATIAHFGKRGGAARALAGTPAKPGAVAYNETRSRSLQPGDQQTAQTASKDSPSHSTLGIVRYMNDGLDEAVVEKAKKAVEADPNSATAHNYLGLTSAGKGWQEEAEKELRRPPWSIALKIVAGIR